MITENFERSFLQPTRIVFDHESRHCSEKTVIVLGSGRGGTSMVAGALAILGVPMNGAPFDFVEGEFNGEDLEILAAVLGRPIILREGRNPILGDVETCSVEERCGSLASIIQDRNATFSTWGFKDPSSFTYLNIMRSHFRNPIFVTVFRDLAAIAEREFVSNGVPIVAGLSLALERYASILRLIETWKIPTLVVSNERATTNRRKFVADLLDFVGVSKDESRLTLAEMFIDPTSGYKNIREFMPAFAPFDRQS